MISPRRSSLRLATFGIVCALVACVLAACGSTEEDKASSKSPGNASAFPVTISHRFGKTTIKQLPKRVVAIGGGDMETAISLGVDPVIGADWFGYTKTRSWVKKALKGAPAPELVGTTQLPYEQIAAANPDLILYVNSLNDEAVYHKLAEIAPTIAASASVKNAYGVPWQDQLATIAKATGTTQRAKTVLADTNTIIDKAKKENPEFQGKTITAGVFTNNSMSVWFPSDPRMQLLQQLGFKVNSQISKLDNGSFYLTLSDEQLQLMNADLIFLAARDADGKVVKAVTDNTVFHALSTVRAGHVAYWPGPGVVNTNTEGGDFSSALSIGGPLGIAYSVPKLIPMLRGALESKKATE